MPLTATLRQLLFRWFAASSRATRRVEEVDQQTREIRHDLKNIQARNDALARLVSSMREDDLRRDDRSRRDV